METPKNAIEKLNSDSVNGQNIIGGGHAAPDSDIADDGNVQYDGVISDGTIPESLPVGKIQDYSSSAPDSDLVI